MSVKKSFFRLPAVVIFAIMVSAVMFGCGSDDNGLAPVEFTYSKVYTGTYRVVQNWQASDSSWTECYATFSFESGYGFHMWIDSIFPGVDFDPCSVEGSFNFTGDSLELTITNFNLNQDLCNPDVAPNAKFRYMIDGDYIIFECREDPPYRKLELYGR